MTWPQKNKLIFVTSLKSSNISDTTHVDTTCIILKPIYEINLLCNISYFYLHVNVSSVSKKKCSCYLRRYEAARPESVSRVSLLTESRRDGTGRYENINRGNKKRGKVNEYFKKLTIEVF